MMRSGFFHSTMISVSLVASSHQLELSRYQSSPVDVADHDTPNFAEEGVALEQELAMVDSTELIHFRAKEAQAKAVKQLAS